jgi:hypothetical protein
MEQFLNGMIGKTIDVYCGASSSLRGEVVKVGEGVLHLKDDEQRICFISIDKINVVWEARENEHRAGFVPSRSDEK